MPDEGKYILWKQILIQHLKITPKQCPRLDLLLLSASLLFVFVPGVSTDTNLEPQLSSPKLWPPCLWTWSASLSRSWTRTKTHMPTHTRNWSMKSNVWMLRKYFSCWKRIVIKLSKSTLLACQSLSCCSVKQLYRTSTSSLAPCCLDRLHPLCEPQQASVHSACWPKFPSF